MHEMHLSTSTSQNTGNLPGTRLQTAFDHLLGPMQRRKGDCSSVKVMFTSLQVRFSLFEKARTPGQNVILGWSPYFKARLRVKE